LEDLFMSTQLLFIKEGKMQEKFLRFYYWNME